MTRRILAGRKVSPIGLGCMNIAWAYGTPPTRSEAEQLFQHALDSGCDHFDTANIYGNGLSEEVLRTSIIPRRKEFLLATKTGIRIEGDRRDIDCSPDSITASLDASLKRLGTDHVDLFYMHRFDPKVPIAESVGAMVRAIEAGKIGAYGVSEWSAAHIREAHSVHPMAAVQTEYSLWTRNVEVAVLEATRELGIALVAFSPLGRGALGGTLGDLSGLEGGDMRHQMPRFQPDNWPRNRALIDALTTLAQSVGATPAQLALAWVLSRGEHLHAIPGTRFQSNFDQNHAVSALHFDAAILLKAGELLNQETVQGHRYSAAMFQSIDTEEPQV